MAVQPHQVEREAGDGSREQIDDLYEGAAYRHDERAETETTFWESDIDKLVVSDRRKQRLHRALRRQEGENPGETYQDGRRDRKAQNRHEWKRRQAGIYCSHVDATAHQKSRSIHLVMDVFDFTEFGSYTKEQCILGVINVVAREDGRFIEDEEPFKRLMEAEDVTPRGLRNIRQMIRERL